MNIFYEETGKLIRKYRIDRKLTQQDMADRLNVSRTCYASWE